MKPNKNTLLINKKYYNDLSKFETLTEEQVKELCIKYKQGDANAFNQLIESNLKLVIYFAKQYDITIKTNEVISLDDLISEGNIGLIKAINKYNPFLGVKFASYASYWIKKEIQDFIYNNCEVIRIPQSRIISDSKILKETIKLFNINEQEPTANDIEALDMFTAGEIKHYFDRLQITRIENENTIADTETTLDEIENLKHHLKCLTKQERMVIKLNYGFDGAIPLNQTQIADKLNLSKMRISQVINSAMKKLKNKLN